MTPYRTLTSSVLLASLLALSACNTSPMASNVSTLNARLSGANEVPAANSNGSGTLSANLDKTTRVLSWTVTYSGLALPWPGTDGTKRRCGAAVYWEPGKPDPGHGNSHTRPDGCRDEWKLVRQFAHRRQPGRRDSRPGIVVPLRSGACQVSALVTET